MALLLAGWDNEHGPVLYVYMPNSYNRYTPRLRFHTDPSGTFVKYEAKAIGSGSEGAQTALQEAFRKDLTLAEAEVLALSTLKQVMEDKVCAGSLCCLRWLQVCEPLPSGDRDQRGHCQGGSHVSLVQ